MPELNHLTAARAARDVAAGKITSEALVRDCLDRIRERDRDVQAWVYCDPDGAIAQAREIDRKGARGPLAGVPVAFKDVLDTSDMPTEYNSPIYKGYRPRTDAACAALTRRAGGVVLGKTVTTEFATRIAGPTRNPLNLEHTPGGSSSGSAAAVADFMAPLAFGTQTGGSTIRPAAYCGVVGYKPTFNTINRSGMKIVSDSIDTIGVIARTVEDCALLVHAVASLPMPDFSVKLPHAPRVGFCRTSRWDKASAASQQTVEAAAQTFARAGAPVKDFVLPDAFDALYDEQEIIANYEGAHALAHERFTFPELLSDHLRGKLAEFAPKRDAYEKALRHVRACGLALRDLMRDFDVLLTPATVGEPEKGITNTGNSLFNRVWTVLRVPAVTVPAGRGPLGLPLGIQLVGAFEADRTVLEVAEWAHQAIR